MEMVKIQLPGPGMEKDMSIKKETITDIPHSASFTTLTLVMFIHGHVGYSSTYKYLKPCGLGTKVDGGTKAIFFGRGEYRGNVDFRNSYINIYFEDDGAVSVYFGDLDGNTVIQH